MKILIPTAYYKPELFSSSQLNDDLEMALLKDGNFLTVVTPTPSRGLSDKTRKEYKSKLYEENYDGRLIVRRIPLPYESKSKMLRAFRYILMSWKEYSKCVKETGVSVVFAASTPPTQGLLSSRIAKKLGVPFVYNLQDVFPDSLVNTGLTKKGSLLWKIGRWVENTTYREADRIIVISNDFKQNIIKKGVLDSKIEIVYNWVDIEQIHHVDKTKNTLFDEFRIDRDKFTVVYAGSLGVTQNAIILVDVAEHLKEDQEIQIVIFGQGEQENQIRKMIEERKLTNIRLMPLQPADRVSEVYSVGDVGVVTCMPGTGASGMPSKTWSILASGTPVVASFDCNSELQKILKENDCGFCVDPASEQNFVSVITSLKEDKKLLRCKGLNGRAFVMQCMKKDFALKAYTEIIKSVVR